MTASNSQECDNFDNEGEFINEIFVQIDQIEAFLINGVDP
jgi:hypothetical protein